jgi:hypothetical protein
LWHRVATARCLAAIDPALDRVALAVVGRVEVRWPVAAGAELLAVARLAGLGDMPRSGGIGPVGGLGHLVGLQQPLAQVPQGVLGLAHGSRVVTVMPEAGWSAKQLRRVITGRSLPSPVRTSVGAIIAARLRAAQAYPPTATAAGPPVTTDLLRLIRSQSCNALSLGLPPLARALVCTGPYSQVRTHDRATSRSTSSGRGGRVTGPSSPKDCARTHRRLLTEQ